MKQLQVTVPRKNRKKAEEILGDYSSDVSSNSAESNGNPVTEFTLTVESGDIDELTEALKSVKEIESGELSIRVLDQESLIRKGSTTRGSSSILSQEELYSQAQESSTFNMAQWGLIALSAVIASLGLAADNIVVVVGAMMVAPILSPFISGALSLAVGDSNLLFESVKTGVLSVLLAIFMAFLVMLPFPVGYTPALGLVSTPSVVSVMLALLVGGAAALTFATGLRDEIAGVAVAIALIPPIASIGIGLSMMDIGMVMNAGAVAGMNILSVIIAGFTSFKLIGVRPPTYYREEQAEKISFIVPAAVIIFLLIAAPIAYSTYIGHNTGTDVRHVAQQSFGDQFIQVKDVNDHKVVYVVGKVDKQRFLEKLPESVDVSVVELSRIN
ncbi:MAG: TIGR00341 family protein [Candidatus Nanohaloarchaea archaeon]